MKHLALTLVASGLLLAGCGTMAPDYQQPKAPIPVGFPGEMGGASVESQAWTSVIESDKLKQVIALALKNNRDVKLTALNIESARAQYQITKSDLLPSVNGTFSQTAQGKLDGGGVSHSYEAGLTMASYELDFWGRVRSLKDSALETYLGTESAHQSAQISLVSSTAQAWMQLSSDLFALQESLKSFDSYRKTYDLTKARVDRGVSSEVELRQAETALQASRSTYLGYQGQVQLDRNALRLLVGDEVPANLLPSAEDIQAPLVMDVPAGLPSDLLNNRPDIQEAEHNLKSANANVGAAKAAFFPTISLTGFAGSASNSLGDLFDNGTGIWRFVPQISLPIFNAGKLSAQRDVAEVTKNIQVATYEKQIQTAFKEVADALATRSQLQQQHDAVSGQLKAAEAAYKLADARYRSGIDSYLSLLATERSLETARITHANLLLSMQANRIVLYKALGGKLPVPTP